MKNQVQLITYVNRLSEGGIKELNQLLMGPLKHLFGGIHLLPFFDPIDGTDAGFDPIDHRKVDERLGNWEDIKTLSSQVDIMADMIVNHMSAQSIQFQDVLAKGTASPHHALFLTMDHVFPTGATENEIAEIYRPRPGLPYTEIKLADGSTQQFWTTFTSNQIDINVLSQAGEAYLESILTQFAQAGINMIRLDAAGYAIKKAGTSCFMIPETFEFIAQLTDKAHRLGIEVLVEIHAYHRQQIEIAKKVDYVYDFALPPLILHALFTQTARYLKDWFAISPRNAITVLDTHDGIGIIDIGPYQGQAGLVPDEEIDLVVETIHDRSRGESRKATGAAASNLDLYQVNCTYYDALGKDDHLYLLARLIQFFAPGIPQVYYTGLLGEPNDMDLLEKTNVGRDINRHYFSTEEVLAATKRPVVQHLFHLIRFRNRHQAFQGEFSLMETEETLLQVEWRAGADRVNLQIDMGNYQFMLKFTDRGVLNTIDNDWAAFAKTLVQAK